MSQKLAPLRPWLTAAALAATVACVPPPTPVETFGAGNREAALKAQQEAVREAHPRDRAVEQLRLGSMAYALGDADRAEAAWRKAVGAMTNFEADGEFAAVLAAEDRKEWKGEPYEKMAAFVSLGALLHAEGDYGNALAMYKSAVLADTGSSAERFRSDFVVAFALQALAYAADRDPAQAREAMQRAIDAKTSRHTLDVLTDALKAARDKRVPVDEVQVAKAVLLEALPGGVSAKPRDPQEAARATISWANDLLRQQEKLPRKERLGVFVSFRGGDFDKAARALPRVAEAFTRAVRNNDKATEAYGEQLQRQLDRILDSPPPVVLLVEQGRGPRKIRTGEHGEVLTIVPSRSPASTPYVEVTDAPMQAVQAVALDLLSDVAYAAGNDNLGLVGDLLSLGALLSSVLTNATADIRQWDLAPERWVLVTVHAPPGSHEITVDSRRYTVDVPERGQIFHLIPALPPGGPSALGRTK